MDIQDMPQPIAGLRRVYSADQFDVREELGHGAYGNVYRGVDKLRSTEVAIKQIDLESDENILEFKKEIALLSTCNNEYITKYYGCFVRGFKLWIIMEYLPGGSLSDLLAPGPIKESNIVGICHDMVQGLEYLHENGKIHRDLKPANILLSKDGYAKIADFGVSTQLSNKLSLRNTYIGTPYYMAPEVILHHHYNFKADIWSLGITLLELANGRPPLYQYHPMQAVYMIEKNEPPTLVGDEFSDTFKEFISLCLKRDPNERPTTKQLLKHKFLSGNRHSHSKLLMLIERKKKWDENNCGDKLQNKKYYVPTMESGSGSSITSEDTTEFDFDLESLGNLSESTIKAKKLGGLDFELELENGTLELNPINGVDYERMSHQLNAMLNLSFNKISSKLNLSTYQYDHLVNFKTSFLNDVLMDENKRNRDIFQIFFKNFLKRLYNSDIKPLKLQLFPKVILENQIELHELRLKQFENLKMREQQQQQQQQREEVPKIDKPRERDHIEELLLSRWAEGMIEKWVK